MPSIIHNLQLLNNQGIRKMAAFELAEFAELFEFELFTSAITKYVISKPFLIFKNYTLIETFCQF